MKVSLNVRMTVIDHLVNFFADLFGVICNESIQEVWYDYDNPVTYRRREVVGMSSETNFAHRQKRYATLTGVQVVFQI